MENHFGFTKQILIITWNYNCIIISIGIRLTCQSKSVSHNNTCHMATHRSRPVAFLCLRVNIVMLCLFPCKNKLWFSWCTFAITFTNIYLNYLYCNFVQILVYFTTIFVIWQLKEADLKPFYVSGVNIVKLDLSF